MNIRRKQCPGEGYNYSLRLTRYNKSAQIYLPFFLIYIRIYLIIFIHKYVQNYVVCFL